MRIIKIDEELDCNKFCGILAKELENNKDIIRSRDCVITICIKPVIDINIERHPDGKKSSDKEENNN